MAKAELERVGVENGGVSELVARSENIRYQLIELDAFLFKLSTQKTWFGFKRSWL